VSVAADNALGEAAEVLLANRYCLLSEAGVPIQQALDLAMQTDFDIDAYLVRSSITTSAIPRSDFGNFSCGA